MIAKKPTRTIEFTDQDENFIRQLAVDIGCHYCKAGERTYKLNKFDSDIHSGMGILAWVHKEDEDYFWITTRKVWVEEAKTSALAGGKAAGIDCFPRDAQHGDSVCFDTREGYEKAVRALRLINRVR